MRRTGKGGMPRDRLFTEREKRKLKRTTTLSGGMVGVVPGALVGGAAGYFAPYLVGGRGTGASAAVGALLGGLLGAVCIGFFGYLLGLLGGPLQEYQLTHPGEIDDAGFHAWMAERYPGPAEGDRPTTSEG